MIMSYYLERRWRKLYNSSLIKAESLKPIKKKFADMTTIEINTFLTNVSFSSIIIIMIIILIEAIQ